MSEPALAAPAHEIVQRTCPLCEAHCGIAVEVDRSRQTVVTVRGDEDDPFSQGYICPKAYGLKGLHEDPDRIRRPLRRRGNDWDEIGWEEAFDLVAGRLREIRDAHGADAIAIYNGNPTAHDYGALIYGQSFLRALGTRWRFSASSVDQLPKMVSSCLMFGAPLAFPVPDIDRTDYFLVLGANPVVSNGSLMTAPDMPGRLRRLRERGGRLVVVAPRRSETAELADEHVPLRPGSDAHFLFGIVHTLFAEDRVRLRDVDDLVDGVEAVRTLAKDFAPEAVAPACGVPAETIRRIARELVAAERAAVYGRIGTCTQSFGTLASWLVDVVNTLTGNLDRPGGVLWPRSPVGPADDRPRRRGRVPYARWKSRVRGLPEFAGELPSATLAEEIDTPGDGRVRALVTTAGNPVLSTPNGARLERALESLDFMVSLDLYLNETTRFADVILPTTSQLERSNYDLVFNGVSVRHFSKFSPAVLPKPDDARHVWEIQAELAARLGGVPVEVVHELMLSQLLGNTVGKPGTACPEVAEAEAREALGDEPGPERMLDLMLRAGPYGDRFQTGSDGLSLERLKAHPAGIDLGPLVPRLPDMLATESGRVELAPELCTNDVARLRASLEPPEPDRLVLVGRRHLRSNNSWMRNVRALAKGPERCTLLVHPDDAERIGLVDGGRARIRSRVGEIEAPVVVSDEIRVGVVSLPHGFGHGAPGARLATAEKFAGVNSNRLTDELGVEPVSGNGILNGIPVEVTAAT